MWEFTHVVTFLPINFVLLYVNMIAIDIDIMSGGGAKALLASVKVCTAAGTGEMGLKNGKANSSAFNYPFGVCYVISEAGNHCLRKWNLQTNDVSTFTGIPGQSGSVNGLTDKATFNVPQG